MIDSVVAYTLMKFFFALLATLFLAAPAWAVDVMMGADGNLIFEPADVTIWCAPHKGAGMIGTVHVE